MGDVSTAPVLLEAAADKDPELAQAAIGPMTGALARRGPDGEGFAAWPGVAFGHRRLAIEELVAPRWCEVRQVGATTFAVMQESAAR